MGENKNYLHFDKIDVDMFMLFQFDQKQYNGNKLY